MGPARGEGNQRKSRRSKSLWFLFKSIKKNADFGGSKGGPHGRGPGRRWRGKPARQPKCCICLEKAISGSPSNPNILLFHGKYCQKHVPTIKNVGFRCRILTFG